MKKRADSFCIKAVPGGYYRGALNHVRTVNVAMFNRQKFMIRSTLNLLAVTEPNFHNRLFIPGNTRVLGNDLSQLLLLGIVSQDLNSSAVSS